VSAVSFAAASRRLGGVGIPVLTVVLVVVRGSGVAVIHQYYTEVVLNGGGVRHRARKAHMLTLADAAGYRR
jgi:hypothetical protein